MKGVVLDPTATAPAIDDPAGPPLGALAGRTIGLRVDNYWPFWDVITDEWATLLRADGASIVTWRHIQPTGKATDEILAGLHDFTERVDAMVVGLCNCGSCTMWAVHDAMVSLERERSTVLVATSHFEDLARRLARHRGRPEVRLLLLPYPIEDLGEDEHRQLARDHYEALLATMGARR